MKKIHIICIDENFDVILCANINQDKHRMIRAIMAESFDHAKLNYIHQLRNEAWTAVQIEIMSWSIAELNDCLVDHIQDYDPTKMTAYEKVKQVLTIYYNNYQTLTPYDLYDRLVLNA